MTSLSGISPEAMAKIRKAAYVYRQQPAVSSAVLDKTDLIEELQTQEVELDLTSLTEADVLDSEVLTPAVKQPPRGSA
jgi:hypothetical protein